MVALDRLFQRDRGAFSGLLADGGRRSDRWETGKKRRKKSRYYQYRLNPWAFHQSED
jgi:hypothetical protein